MHRFSRAQYDDIWARWRRGERQYLIAAALACRPASIRRVIRPCGGIAPRPRSRAPRVLSREDREEISRGLARELSFRALAQQLRRPVSTISREVRRHGGRAAYRAEAADTQAWHRARRPKACRLATEPRLRQVVAQRLAADWSPQQIAGWLRVTYAGDPAMQISHETIYRSLFIQSRGVLRAELRAHLRRPRLVRRAQAAPRRGLRHGQIVDAVSIRERPAAVEDRAVPGHWEGDLVTGAHASHVATLVERHSRYVLLVKVPSKETAGVVAALTRVAKTLPRGLMTSLTWDRGTELAAHRRFTVATDVRVYFCDPQSPWQRGSNENTNGLLRQYFPTGLDLSAFSQRQLNAIARRLNTRPRKTLGYRTPAEAFSAIVASTA